MSVEQKAIRSIDFFRASWNLLVRAADVTSNRAIQVVKPARTKIIRKQTAITRPKYILSNVSGPSHNPIFKTDLYINNHKISSSEGPRKIISEQRAAEKAIDYINKNNFDGIKTKKSFFKKVLNSFR